MADYTLRIKPIVMSWTRYNAYAESAREVAAPIAELHVRDLRYYAWPDADTSKDKAYIYFKNTDGSEAIIPELERPLDYDENCVIAFYGSRTQYIVPIRLFTYGVNNLIPEAISYEDDLSHYVGYPNNQERLQPGIDRALEPLRKELAAAPKPEKLSQVTNAQPQETISIVSEAVDIIDIYRKGAIARALWDLRYNYAPYVYSDESQFTIGDLTFKSDETGGCEVKAIEVEDVSNVQLFPMMRSAGSLPVGGAHTTKVVNITIGIERARWGMIAKLLAMIRNAPFQPVINEKLNSQGIYEVAMRSLSVVTSIPDSSTAEITLQLLPFDIGTVINASPGTKLWDLICWPFYTKYIDSRAQDHLIDIDDDSIKPLRLRIPTDEVTQLVKQLNSNIYSPYGIVVNNMIERFLVVIPKLLASPNNLSGDHWRIERGNMVQQKSGAYVFEPSNTAQYYYFYEQDEGQAEAQRKFAIPLNEVFAQYGDMIHWPAAANELRDIMSNYTGTVYTGSTDSEVWAQHSALSAIQPYSRGGAMQMLQQAQQEGTLYKEVTFDGLYLKGGGFYVSNHLVPIFVDDSTLPMYQYMGPGDVRITYDMKGSGPEALESINQLHAVGEYTRELIRLSRATDIGYWDQIIWNPRLIQELALMGSGIPGGAPVRITDIHEATVPGEPETIATRVEFIVDPFSERQPFRRAPLSDVDQIGYQLREGGEYAHHVEAMIQGSLETASTYPDLALPTRAEFRAWYMSLLEALKEAKDSGDPNADDQIKLITDMYRMIWSVNDLASLKDSAPLDPDFYVPTAPLEMLSALEFEAYKSIDKALGAGVELRNMFEDGVVSTPPAEGEVAKSLQDEYGLISEEHGVEVYHAYAPTPDNASAPEAPSEHGESVTAVSDDVALLQAGVYGVNALIAACEAAASMIDKDADEDRREYYRQLAISYVSTLPFLKRPLKEISFAQVINGFEQAVTQWAALNTDDTDKFIEAVNNWVGGPTIANDRNIAALHAARRVYEDAINTGSESLPPLTVQHLQYAYMQLEDINAPLSTFAISLDAVYWVYDHDEGFSKGRDAALKDVQKNIETIEAETTVKRLVNVGDTEPMPVAPPWNIPNDNEFYDFTKYGANNRLIRCFPTFHILAYKEGRVIGPWKIRDYFTRRNGITYIDLYKARGNPTHVLEFAVAAVYPSAPRVHDDQGADILGNLGNIAKTWLSRKVIDANFERELQQLLNGTLLDPDTRISLRMGYGAVAARLPLVFNGRIQESNVTRDRITVVAVGDGIELTNQAPPARSHIGSTISGSEPRNIICGMLSARGPVGAHSLDGGFVGKIQRFIHANTIDDAMSMATPIAALSNSSTTIWTMDDAKRYAESMGTLARRSGAAATPFTYVGVVTIKSDSEIIAVNEQISWVYTPRSASDVATLPVQSILPILKRSAPHIYSAISVDLATDKVVRLRQDADIYKGTLSYWDDADSMTTKLLHIEVSDIKVEPGAKVTPYMASGYPELLGFLKEWWSSNPYGIAHFGQPQYGHWGFSWEKWGEIGQNVFPGSMRNCGTSTRAIGPNAHKYLFAESTPPKLPYPARWGMAKRLALESLFPPLALFDMYGLTVSNLIYLIGREYSKDELNVKVDLRDKTPWDVINILARAVPGFVAAVAPFGLRSTLFYGRPYFNAAYAYNYKKLNELGFFESVAEAELRKPFSQIHVAHSSLNLIKNNITINLERMKTIVTGQYHGINGLPILREAVLLGQRIPLVRNLLDMLNLRVTYNDNPTMPVYADIGIEPQNQRSAVVDTGIVCDLGDTLKNINPFSFRAHNLVPNNVALSALTEFMSYMYDGAIVMYGNGALKPEDWLYLDDQLLEMRGSVVAHEVNHVMSMETGFITTVTPALLTYNYDATILHRVARAAQFATAVNFSLARIATEDITAASQAIPMILTQLLSRYVIARHVLHHVGAREAAHMVHVDEKIRKAIDTAADYTREQLYKVGEVIRVRGPLPKRLMRSIEVIDYDGFEAALIELERIKAGVSEGDINEALSMVRRYLKGLPADAELTYDMVYEVVPLRIRFVRLHGQLPQFPFNIRWTKEARELKPGEATIPVVREGKDGKLYSVKFARTQDGRFYVEYSTTLNRSKVAGHFEEFSVLKPSPFYKEKYYTIDEVSHLLGRSKVEIERMVENGELVAVYNERDNIRYIRFIEFTDEIDDLLRRVAAAIPTYKLAMPDLGTETLIDMAIDSFIRNNNLQDIDTPELRRILRSRIKVQLLGEEAADILHGFDKQLRAFTWESIFSKVRVNNRKLLELWNAGNIDFDAWALRQLELAVERETVGARATAEGVASVPEAVQDWLKGLQSDTERTISTIRERLEGAPAAEANKAEVQKIYDLLGELHGSPFEFIQRFDELRELIEALPEEFPGRADLLEAIGNLQRQLRAGIEINWPAGMSIRDAIRECNVEFVRDAETGAVKQVRFYPKTAPSNPIIPAAGERLIKKTLRRLSVEGRRQLERLLKDAGIATGEGEVVTVDNVTRALRDKTLRERVINILGLQADDVTKVLRLGERRVVLAPIEVIRLSGEALKSVEGVKLFGVQLAARFGRVFSERVLGTAIVQRVISTRSWRAAAWLGRLTGSLIGRGFRLTAGLVKKANPVALLFMAATGWIGGWVYNYMANLQAVKVVPLLYHNYPYIGGIQGHQGLVVGDTAASWRKWLTHAINSAWYQWTVGFILPLHAPEITGEEVNLENLQIEGKLDVDVREWVRN